MHGIITDKPIVLLQSLDLEETHIQAKILNEKIHKHA